MSVPEIVGDRLADESPIARVPLGGDDELLVTPTRTLVYRAEGLLSGESVEEYPHDAEAIRVTEGRRKSTIKLDHGIDGESALTLPSSRLDDALPPVLGGVLAVAGVIEPDEGVLHVYRIGELTLMVTEGRVIKHVGSPIWDDEAEEYAYARVTRLDIERGDVASQVIVEVEGRPQRVKLPSGIAREVRERIERALLAYHGVETYEEFAASVAPPAETEDAETEEEEEPGEAGAEARTGGIEFGLNFPDDEPLGVTRSNPDDAGDVASELAELHRVVARQNELIQAHTRVIEQLIDELRRGR